MNRPPENEANHDESRGEGETAEGDVQSEEENTVPIPILKIERDNLPGVDPYNSVSHDNTDEK